MNPEAVHALVREALMLLATVGWPLFALMLVAGLTIGVLQASTQVNDPAVGAVPRLALAGVAIWLLGGWIVQRLAAFLAAAILHMAERG